MSANVQPNYTAAGNIGSVLVTAANTKSDGTATGIGTDIFKVLTAGSNGSYVDRIDFWPTSTVANSAMTTTVARAFLCSVLSGATSSANCFLIGETVLSGATADSSTAAQSAVSIPIGYRIPAGYTILVTNHIAPAANTNWRANVIAADY